MTVATWNQPDSTTDSGTSYKTAIDAAIRAMSRIGAWFAPHEQSTADMTVRLEAGFVETSSGLTEVAAQSTGTITAPVSNPRKDLVVVDAADGTVSVITGSEAASPAYPALTAGKIPIAGVTLATSTTAITNDLIEDLRGLSLAPATTGEMEAGSETELRAMSPAGVAAAIAALASGEDQTARDMATINAWEIARIDGLSNLGMVNTYIDVFTDETGISAGSGTNEYYNDAGDYYIGASLASEASVTLDKNQTSIGDSTYAQVIAAAALSNAGSGVRVTFEAASTQNLNISKAYIGEQASSGDAWDIETGTITQLTFGGGNANTTITAGNTGDTDEVTFTVDPAKSYVIKFYVQSTGSMGIRAKASVTNWTGYKKTGDSAASENDGGFSASDDAVGVKDLSLLVVSNLTLVSASVTASSAPASLRVLADIEEMEAATENTDFVASVSRDGGSTWTAATLSAISGDTTGRAVYAATVDVSGQPSGTDVRWRLVTSNTKDIRLHRIGLQADVALTV